MDENLNFTGKVAVITGAASGIGAGLARYASSLGMRLVLADWNAKPLQQVADKLETEYLTVEVDVRNEKSVQELCHTAFDKFESVDLLFNNAGVLSSGLSWEIDQETWQRSIDINIMGVVNVLRHFVPRLIESGRKARIVNTGSVGGFFPTPLMATYSASKFAITAITEALALELASINSKIAVSLLAPGPVKTGLMDENSPSQSQAFMDALRNMADKKGLSPDEFAPLVFEAIDRGDYWITPQPESLDDRLTSRTKMILERKDPVSARNIKGR